MAAHSSSNLYELQPSLHVDDSSSVQALLQLESSPTLICIDCFPENRPPCYVDSPSSLQLSETELWQELNCFSNACVEDASLAAIDSLEAYLVGDDTQLLDGLMFSCTDLYNAEELVMTDDALHSPQEKTPKRRQDSFEKDDQPAVPEEIPANKKLKMSPHSVIEAREEAEEEEDDDDELGEAERGRRRRSEVAPPPIKDLSGAHVESGRKGSSHKSSKGQAVGKESRWAEQLLGACAAAIVNNNVVRTQHLMWVLNDLAALGGDANQRLAAHGLRALYARVTGVRPEAPQPPPTVHSLLRFYEASPWHHLPYMVANAALSDALERSATIHVIDIGVSLSTQWPTFIESLATRPSGAPSLLRLTIVLGPSATGVPADAHGAAFHRRLETFASKMGVELQLQTVCVPLEEVSAEHLDLRTGESLAICCQFRLHHLNYDSASMEAQPLASLLRRLHRMKPELFILSDNDTDNSSNDFLTRVHAALDFNWKFLDSTAAAFNGEDCTERRLIEEGVSMRALFNNVACEGEARVERNQPHAAWTRQMQEAGFFPSRLKDQVLETAKALLRKYDNKWTMALDDLACTILLHWKDHPTTFCSIWKPLDL